MMIATGEPFYIAIDKIKTNRLITVYLLLLYLWSYYYLYLIYFNLINNSIWLYDFAYRFTYVI